MSRPRIALIGRFAEHTSATRYAGVVSARALLESLWLAGADPVTLLAASDGMDWTSRLEGFDGVLLCGGADVDPALYGETTVHPEVYDVDALQDDADLSLAAYCFEHGVPTLAVCRGLHVVNVLRGGSLVQHMDDHHRHVVHDVVIERGPAGIEPGPITASCYHHQCIGRLGSGLDIVGRAEDGTVEAVTIDSAGWAFGVQWHPEDTAREDPRQLGVFRALVDASR
ncbi:MAG: gamma-glutamyl-gamma-aminobutyrate hydrolase family protein [Actinobacteria bacterium]|nr:gamma-glutamyl-gamma-aminobutyrate hydrolase family protein [Actinomycetota bacterium]